MAIGLGSLVENHLLGCTGPMDDKQKCMYMRRWIPAGPR